MWLFELFKLFYIFCVSFLPVIVDTGVQVKIVILVFLATLVALHFTPVSK